MRKVNMRNISNEQFNKKYYQYKDILYKISYTYVHNVYDADDIVQDVFMKYLNSNESFKTDDNEKYWLIRVTINTCKNFISSNWKKRITFDEDLNKISNNDLGNVAEDKCNYNKLFDIIKVLPHKYKEVIILHYIEEMKVNEISSVLKISVSAVKKRLERARNMIKEQY